jgi:hypothetical protein
MEAVREEPGQYVAYSSIPAGYETKFEWIHQKGGNCGHFDVPTLFYRRKTAEELKADEIFVAEIKYDTMVATFGDMCYLDRLPKSLHKYFDYTVQSRSYDKSQMRVNAADYIVSFDYAKINIMRNSILLNL